MFDDFRNVLSDEENEPEGSKEKAGAFSFPEENETLEEVTPTTPRRSARRIAVPREVLGMNPFQSFVISVLVLLFVMIAGVFLLIITGKMVLF